MLCLVIGAYCEGLGLALRLAYRSSLHSSGIYIVQYLFVVLSVSQQSLLVSSTLRCRRSRVHSWPEITSSSVVWSSTSMHRSIFVPSNLGSSAESSSYPMASLALAT